MLPDSAQHHGERLTRRIVSRIEQARAIGGAQLPDIVQIGIDAPDQDTHVLIARTIGGIGGEQAKMPSRFGYRGRQVVRRIVGAMPGVGETGAFRIKVCERSHDITRAGACHALPGGHQANFACLVPQPRIGKLLRRDQCLPHRRIGADPLVKIDRGIFRGNDPDRCRPSDPPERRRQDHGPRAASRYCRTAARSVTSPALMRSSGVWPPKCRFGRRNHPSAWAWSEYRI